MMRGGVQDESKMLHLDDAGGEGEGEEGVDQEELRGHVLPVLLPHPAVDLLHHLHGWGLGRWRGTLLEGVTQQGARIMVTLPNAYEHKGGGGCSRYSPENEKRRLSAVSNRRRVNTYPLHTTPYPLSSIIRTNGVECRGGCYGGAAGAQVRGPPRSLRLAQPHGR